MSKADLEKLRAFVASLLREHDDYADFSDAESLVKSGRIDSLSVVKLVTFLECDFAVNFDVVEFDPQRFDSVAEIARVIEEARSAV